MANSSVYENIKDAVVSGIQGLLLPGLDSANILKRKVITNRTDDLPAIVPCVLVANLGNKAPSRTAGSNSRDDIPYGVVVACLQGSNQNQTLNSDRFTEWGERIQSFFRFQRLAGVTSVFTCFPLQDSLFDPPMWFKNYDSSVQVFQFMSREGRG